MVRQKNRYLLCEINYMDGKRLQRNLKTKDIYHCVRDAVLREHGEYGFATTVRSLSVQAYFHPNIVMIKVSRDGHKMLQSALFFVRKIGQYEAFFNTLHISGTIRTCQKFYIRYLRKELPTLLRECSTPDEEKEVKRAISYCVPVEVT
ncbi:ribonuclease P/MRP protein subunit POP5-like isoform X2 [Ostrea edulis]|uniref:ribonuclease P/MRP protein subunit POP5-like isoform X2 n=1 Tax=Ostrea edulis TaxID=37623 RepID=UPI0024AE943D|nr:ribonuclease P/MRP protein subunit POP5-like isoform X2 [Ostrea edulis]